MSPAVGILIANSRQPKAYPRSILPTSGCCQEGEPGSSLSPELLSWRGREYPAPQHSSRPATACSHGVGQGMADGTHADLRGSRSPPFFFFFFLPTFVTSSFATCPRSTESRRN